MTLPIVLVALGFWAVIFIDYRKRPWRRLLLPIEGPLKLVFVIYAGSTAFGVAAAARIVQGPLFFHNILFDDDFFLRSSFNDLWDTLFTEEEVFVVDEDENGGDITVDKKFWEKGLTQLLLVCTCNTYPTKTCSVLSLSFLPLLGLQLVFFLRVPPFFFNMLIFLHSHARLSVCLSRTI